MSTQWQDTILNKLDDLRLHISRLPAQETITIPAANRIEALFYTVGDMFRFQLELQGFHITQDGWSLAPGGADLQ